MDKPLKKFRIEASDSGNFKSCIDKIMNSHFFRKLSGKTQVILSLMGPMVRTRLTHTVEVARIAREISEDLGLNENLCEAIALAHDIGHTPFGHVGERILKEIMCGCDTLKGRVRDIDFENSGFKHNLQSFRVLTKLEGIANDQDSDWAYILWGVPVHSEMSYSKLYSGMENEIYISCKHCDLVFSCFFHEKKECKRNILDKKKKKETPKFKVDICKPWYCATLNIKKKEDVHNKDLKFGVTTEEYLEEEFIKDEEVRDVFCEKKCYLAKLYKFKIGNKKHAEYFPYLFDHPFPNSFYVKFLYERFIANAINDFVSIEAQVVMQADEIAQRQQDLEDAVSKNLISFETAKENVEKLVDKVLSDNKTFLLDIRNSKNQKELGELIVKVYKKLICEATISNFNVFATNREQEKISIYCLMDIIYWINRNDNLRKEWLSKELSSLQSNSNNWEGSATIDEFFEINYEESYFYFVAWKFFDDKSKIAEFTDYNDLLIEIINCLKSKYNYEPHNSAAIQSFKSYLIEIDKIGKFLKDRFEGAFNNFIDDNSDNKTYWKTIRQLNLFSFHLLNTICKQNMNSDNLLLCDELRNVNIHDLLKESRYDEKQAFEDWRRSLRTDSNSVLAKLVNFVRENDVNKKDKIDTLKGFRKRQNDSILKSEIVEKNDGKANYILKRLFGAYMTNSHQLPDSGLIYILLSLTDEEIFKKIQGNEIETFNKYFSKLKKTMINSVLFAKKSKAISEINFLYSNDGIFDDLKNHTSNEIRALLDGKKKLYQFLRKFNDKATQFEELSRSEVIADSRKLREVLLEFRGILDNPILNAMPYWKSILARGVCDHIASLTDQEAINEYEKLYTGIMELV